MKGKTVVVLLALASSQSVRGQGPGTPSSSSVTKAEQAVDKAAAGKITLSDAAKNTLAVEALRQQAARQPSISDPQVSTGEAEQLISALKSGQAGGQIQADEAQSQVTDAKVRAVASTLMTEIDRSARGSNVNLDPNARSAMAADLQHQTEELAKSGLPVDTIKKFNNDYTVAIYSASKSTLIDRSRYEQAKADVFNRLVRLTITSEPPGAEVQVAATRIGTTEILRKPFESGTMYQFLFTLAGFKTTTRDFYVSPAPVEQTLKEILQPEDKSKP